MYILVHPTNLWGMVSVMLTDYTTVQKNKVWAGKIKGATGSYYGHLKGQSHKKILSKNDFKCVVSRDYNPDFHNINHIFLKKRVNFSSSVTYT
jgi:hypothetical protein